MPVWSLKKFYFLIFADFKFLCFIHGSCCDLMYPILKWIFVLFLEAAVGRVPLVGSKILQDEHRTYFWENDPVEVRVSI